LHWMNPDLFEVETVTVARKRKQGEDSPSFDSPSSVSRITTTSSHSRRRSPKFTDNSLHEDGCLKIRLQRQLGHFPSRPCNKNSRCLLHGWAGTRKEGELMFCETCNVHLCIDYFSFFHTCANLVDIKKELYINYYLKAAALLLNIFERQKVSSQPADYSKLLYYLLFTSVHLQICHRLSAPLHLKLSCLCS
jgi:hypothetical protein